MTAAFVISSIVIVLLLIGMGFTAVNTHPQTPLRTEEVDGITLVKPPLDSGVSSGIDLLKLAQEMSRISKNEDRLPLPPVGFSPSFLSVETDLAQLATRMNANPVPDRTEVRRWVSYVQAMIDED